MLCTLLIPACDQVTDYFSSISFVEVATERTKLINGVESYVSIDQAKSELPAWEVLEQSSLKPKDRRPPFNIYKVSVKNYSHLGISGELHMEFFNNRLLSTWFYPEDFDKYMALLKEKEGLTFQESQHGSREARMAPHTRVWTQKDYKERQYVGWEDTRLGDELNLWIKRYS
jgi:hypothetical protein